MALNELTKQMRSGISPVALDLLEIAAFVYAADQATTRGGIAEFDYGDAWRRDLRFVIPVRCPEVWNDSHIQMELVQTLGFLTDDDYHFSFIRATDPVMPEAYLLDEVQPDGSEFAEVVLFSGGLDSLCGAVEEVLVHKHRVALVSHRSSTRVMARQRTLFEELRSRRGRTKSAPVHIGMTINKGKELNRSFTQRSRSFVFASVAAVIARQVGLSRILFYENGVTSLNLPISPELIGARSSRTTHPQALDRFARLFSLLFNSEFAVCNPYQKFTKAELLQGLRTQGHAELCALSCSCSHVWGAHEEKPHCGRCSQCVDRRVSVLAAALSDGDDPLCRYESDPLTGERDGPELTLVERYVGSAREIERIPSVRAFMARFPEVNDALPFLGVASDEGAEDVYQLLKRHAAGVSQAIQAALQDHVPDLYWQRFSARSLLGVVVGRSPPSVYVDTPDHSKETGLVVDSDRFEVRFNGRPCALGNTLEFHLFERLNRSFGVYLTVQEIADDVWKDERVKNNRIQRVVSSIRRCLREAGIDEVVIDGSQDGHYRLVQKLG